jgi:Ca2+-binding RTX toxin-like protein
MPVLTHDILRTKADGIDFSGDFQTWTIAEGVSVGSIKGYGVFSDMDTSTLRNHGDIVSDKSIGVLLTGSDAYLSNTGTVSGVIGAAFGGDNAIVVNSGFIEGTFESGLAFVSDATVANTGLISGITAGITAEGYLTLENDGQIFALGDGVQVGAGGASIVNHGLLAGQLFGIVADRGSVNLANSGEIDGGVALGSGFDYITNDGTILGSVWLGGRQDVYDGRNGHIQSGWVYGQSGSDALIGGEQSDWLSGGDSTDFLSGRGGSDILYGDAGRDLIYGGAGNDYFAYADVSDSLPGQPNRDIIYDFSSADRDKIDVSALDANPVTASDDPFAFIGTNPFSGTPGELRYHALGNGVLVDADVTGDGVSDFSILLAGVHSLAATDFVL